MQHLYNLIALYQFEINILWYLFIGCTILQYILCILLPAPIIGKILPLHDAFHLQKNIDLGYQSLGYALVHTTLFAKLTHLTLVIDVVLWFIIFYTWHPVAVCIALSILCIQHLLFREWQFSLLMLLIWFFTILLAIFVITANGNEAFIDIVKLLLIVNAIVRFIGHIPEPIPPLVLDNTDRFVVLSKNNFNVKIILLIPIGIIAEFASGLPARLFPVQVFIAIQHLAYKPLRFMNWNKVKFASKLIHQYGFKAVPETANLYKRITE